MEKEINILIQQHGSKKAVADLLGITVRHLENCLKGKYIGRSLAKWIRTYAMK